MKRRSVKSISFLMAALLFCSAPVQIVLAQDQETQTVGENVEAALEDTETIEDSTEIILEETETIEAAGENTEAVEESTESVLENLEETAGENTEAIEESTEAVLENLEEAAGENTEAVEESTETVLENLEEVAAENTEAVEETAKIIPDDVVSVQEKNLASETVEKRHGDFLLEENHDDNTACIAQYGGSDIEVIIPAQIDGYTITRIGNHAFSCENIQSISLPEGLIEIGEFAFYNTSLLSIEFPSTLRKIGKQAFHYSDLRSFSFAGDQTVEVGEAAFSNTCMENITVPANIKNIPRSCFDDNLSAKSIVIEEGVETIGDFAFATCQYATVIIIPSSVSTIAYNSFANNIRVERLEIAEGITSLGDMAFCGLISLTAVTLPKSITSIGTDAFRDCNNLVISCYTNTCSHKYAVDNGFEYILLDQPTYTISYELGGGINSEYNPSTYTATAKTIVLQDPQPREYFTFLGWYTDSAFKNPIYEIPKGSTGNLTLYAKWEADTYEITFLGCGGYIVSHSGDSEIYIGDYTQTPELYKESVKLEKCPFTRTGYTFTGWNTKEDGSGKSYADQAAFSNPDHSSLICLYAQWKKNSYTITYNLNGGTNNKSNPASYTATTSTITLQDPTRKGYSFSGWYSDKDCTKKVTQIKKGSTGNKTLYAKWTANKYTVSFNGNGSTSGSTNQLKNCKYGKTYTLTANGFKRKGYSFAGWNTKKDGTGKTYKNKAEIKNLSSKSGGKVTLYAQWKKTKYSITYNLNKGTNNKKNPASYTITTKNVTLQNPTRKGYTFKGWYSDKKYKNKVTQIKKGRTGNITLYAKWTANKYTIKFNGNGATSGSMKAIKNCQYNKSYTLSKNTFKRKGYTFAGWNTKKDGTGKTYKNKAEIKNLTSKADGTVTLYAQWKKK